MVKIWISLALLMLSAGAAIYATDGRILDDVRREGATLLAKAMGTPPDAAPKATEARAGAAAPARQGPASISVEAAAAVAQTTSQDLQSIGTLQSDESVQMTTEIAGRITAIPLSEGTALAEGDIMVQLDDALAKAEVDDAQARYTLAQGNLQRANSLAKSGNVTERARDEALTNEETARAALELAKVRLSKHTIRAPYGGITGIRKVSPGAYITPGQPIVNLEKIDTLKIDFKLPEIYLAQVSAGQTVEIAVDALPDRTFTGTIYAIDPHLDVNGRALSIRARLENPGLVLRPGLFARIKVRGKTKRNVLVVPEAAIVPRGEEKFVFLVRDGQATEVKVKLGSRSNGMVEIVEGLDEAAMVVTAGQHLLKTGSRVEVVVGSNPAARGT